MRFINVLLTYLLTCMGLLDGPPVPPVTDSWSPSGWVGPPVRSVHVVRPLVRTPDSEKSTAATKRPPTYVERPNS